MLLSTPALLALFLPLPPNILLSRPLDTFVLLLRLLLSAPTSIVLLLSLPPHILLLLLLRPFDTPLLLLLLAFNSSLLLFSLSLLAGLRPLVGCLSLLFLLSAIASIPVSPALSKGFAARAKQDSSARKKRKADPPQITSFHDFPLFMNFSAKNGHSIAF